MSLAYFPMYPDRYDSATAHLSILEDGAYSRLLRICWKTPSCKMPDDLEWIFRQMRAQTDADKAAVTAVLSEFFTRGRGKIWNVKLLKIHVQVSVAHSAKSNAGKRGAAAKALKNKETEVSCAEAMLKQLELEPKPKREEEQKDPSGPKSPAETTTAGAPALPPPKRASRLAEDWVLPKSWGEWALDQGMAAEAVRTQGKLFANYWQSKSGKDATKLDWFKTFQNWIIKAMTDTPRGGKPPTGKPQHGATRMRGDQRQVYRLTDGWVNEYV